MCDKDKMWMPPDKALPSTSRSGAPARGEKNVFAEEACRHAVPRTTGFMANACCCQDGGAYSNMHGNS